MLYAIMKILTRKHIATTCLLFFGLGMTLSAQNSTSNISRVARKSLDIKKVNEQLLIFLDTIPFSGVSIETFSDGKIWIEETYKNGLLHGTSRKWHPIGYLFMEINYLNGKITPEMKEWDGNGELVYERVCDSGLLNCHVFSRCNAANYHWDECSYIEGAEGSIWAYYENEISKGTWKVVANKTYFIHHVYLGLNGFIHREIWTNEKGDTIKSTITPKDLAYEKFNAASINQVSYTGERSIFYEHQSRSGVSQQTIEKAPDIYYYSANMKPFTGIVMDFYPELQPKLIADIKGGKLDSIQYFNEQGQQIEGFQDKLIEQRRLKYCEQSPKNCNIISKEQAFEICRNTCPLLDSTNLRSLNLVLAMDSTSKMYKYVLKHDWRNEKSYLNRPLKPKDFVEIEIQAKDGTITKSTCRSEQE
jgi:antitoxin component YwqK of YwqJK toxin-antitoxin module